MFLRPVNTTQLQLVAKLIGVCSCGGNQLIAEFTLAELKLLGSTMKFSALSNPSCLEFGLCFIEQIFQCVSPNVSKGT